MYFRNMFSVSAPLSVDTSRCDGSFSSPTGCSGTSCHYKAVWEHINGTLHFNITAKVNDQQWTGIGFAKERKMVNQIM